MKVGVSGFQGFSARVVFFKICHKLYIIFAALKIHCSSSCKELLDKLGGYETKERGLVEMKVFILLDTNKIFCYSI